MTSNELRKDYLLDRWVAIAAERKSRPVDFARRDTTVKTGTCPFCPGNEDMTPPAVLLYLPSDKGVVKDMDREGVKRRDDWLVRCVPNLFPVFSTGMQPPLEGDSRWHVSSSAKGYHEVLIESLKHDEHPGVSSPNQLKHVISAYFDRLDNLYRDENVKYVSIIRNHGKEAGASLSHAHSQIFAFNQVPHIVGEELEASKGYFKEHGTCALCEVIKSEMHGERAIYENRDFTVFAPWASVHPFEFWILPKVHSPTPIGLSSEKTEALALAMRAALGGLQTHLDDPSYNFGFHIAPDGRRDEHYHWHIEVYPNLAIWGGFEKSTGMFVNIVSPEDAALCLREAVAAEEGRLVDQL